jgi:para-nitrobenzyl esterase
LNVYAPKEIRKKLPVMVWLPGGGHTTGSADVYDGATLATTQNVIVVTINYRLNAFVWLVHPALDGKGKTTNYGLMDQQFALRWGERNISSFCGDPNNVTVFGQSAGGIGTLYQLISPKSKGLFNRVIVESGAVFWRKFPTLAAAEETGKDFAIAVRHFMGGHPRLIVTVSHKPASAAVTKIMTARSVFNSPRRIDFSWQS